MRLAGGILLELDDLHGDARYGIMFQHLYKERRSIDTSISQCPLHIAANCLWLSKQSGLD